MSELKWCKNCGEGVISHCRSRSGTPCPDGLPPYIRRERTERMDALAKAIHGADRFSFENACAAVERAVQGKVVKP